MRPATPRTNTSLIPILRDDWASTWTEELVCSKRGRDAGGRDIIRDVQMPTGRTRHP